MVKISIKLVNKNNNGWETNFLLAFKVRSQISIKIVWLVTTIFLLSQYLNVLQVYIRQYMTIYKEK